MQNSILVCDDEPGLCGLVKTVLERNDHRVKTVNNGEKALSIVEKEKPELLLLDIRMPGLTGWDVLRKMREKNNIEKVPVAMLTGEDLSLAKILRRDMDYLVDYLEKPFKPTELADTVEQILKRIKKILIKKNKIIKEYPNDGKAMAEAFVAWSRIQMIHEKLLEKLKQIKSKSFSDEKASRIEKLKEGEKQTIQQTEIKKEEILELAGVENEY